MKILLNFISSKHLNSFQYMYMQMKAYTIFDFSILTFENKNILERFE